MTLFLRFLGGLALFLYGMRELGRELKKLSGGKLEGVLARAARTPLHGVFFGALVTAAVQSSSATTVMVVGFVNAGLMTLTQAVGVIMGANLGTTLTSWFLSLSGVEGDVPLFILLRPEALCAIFTLAGVTLLFCCKKEKWQVLGGGFVGFGILFFGMETMRGAVEPLAGDPNLGRLLTLFQNPLAGLAAGALLTALLQSSSACVGILQAMTATGGISVAMAIPIVMGQNVGTCATALLSGVGATGNAKRASFLHLYFNVGGAAILYLVFLALKRYDLAFFGRVADAPAIALIHTVFNLSATLLLLPFSKLLVRLAAYTVKDREGGDEKKARGR